MAAPDPTETRPQRPPAAGTRLSVRVDTELHDDLAELMRTGCNASDAIRAAVELTARIYRSAWDVGGYPEGTAPVIASANLPPYETVRQAERHA